MEYITAQKYFPGAFSDTEARLLRTVGQAGHWLPDPCCLRFVELEALEFLRYVGYIECASFGGYRIKGRLPSAPQPTPERAVVARFAALGIVSEKPIVQASGAMKRPGPQPSYVIILPKGKRIPASAWSELADGAYCNGNLYVVQFRKGA